MTTPDARPVSEARLQWMIRVCSGEYNEPENPPGKFDADCVLAFRELQSLRAEVERLRVSLAATSAELIDSNGKLLSALSLVPDHVLCGELQAKRKEWTEAQARIASLEKDAGRYRWLRDQYRLMSPHMDGQHHWAPKMAAILKGPSVDAAIDAALAATKEKTK